MQTHKTAKTGKPILDALINASESFADQTASASPVSPREYQNGVEDDRAGTIKAIRTALKARSGKDWSVTGGRGTAWGWIHISAPPARTTMAHREREGVDRNAPWRERVEEYEAGSEGYAMSFADIDELARLLDLPASQCDGVGIPASSEYRREYIDRAEGRTPSKIGTPYWD